MPLISTSNILYIYIYICLLCKGFKKIEIPSLNSYIYRKSLREGIPIFFYKNGN